MKLEGEVGIGDCPSKKEDREEGQRVIRIIGSMGSNAGKIRM